MVCSVEDQSYLESLSMSQGQLINLKIKKHSIIIRDISEEVHEAFMKEEFLMMLNKDKFTQDCNEANSDLSYQIEP